MCLLLMCHYFWALSEARKYMYILPMCTYISVISTVPIYLYTFKAKHAFILIGLSLISTTWFILASPHCLSVASFASSEIPGSHSPPPSILYLFSLGIYVQLFRNCHNCVFTSFQTKLFSYFL